jgi:hypothetical protein
MVMAWGRDLAFPMGEYRGKHCHEEDAFESIINTTVDIMGRKCINTCYASAQACSMMVR